MRFRVTHVEATFTPEGWPVPTRLRWEGADFTIVDRGRRWRADDGVHVLVRLADGRVFELHSNGSLWRAALVARPPDLV